MAPNLTASGVPGSGSSALGEQRLAATRRLGVQRPVLVGLEAKRRNSRRLPGLIEVDESEPALVRVTPLTRRDVLGVHVGEHRHRGVADVDDARSDLDELTDVNRLLEQDAI